MFVQATVRSENSLRPCDAASFEWGSSPHMFSFDLCIGVLVEGGTTLGRRDIVSYKANELKVSITMLLHRQDMYHECRTLQSSVWGLWDAYILQSPILHMISINTDGKARGHLPALEGHVIGLTESEIIAEFGSWEAAHCSVLTLQPLPSVNQEINTG